MTSRAAWLWVRRNFLRWPWMTPKEWRAWWL